MKLLVFTVRGTDEEIDAFVKYHRLDASGMAGAPETRSEDAEPELDPVIAKDIPDTSLPLEVQLEILKKTIKTRQASRSSRTTTKATADRYTRILDVLIPYRQKIKAAIKRQRRTQFCRA